MKIRPAKQQMITCRIDERVKDMLIQKAKENNVSLSTYIRKVLQDHFNTNLNK